MAVNTKMPLTNTADGYLCEGTDIKGGYFVIDDVANIPSTIAKTGSLCYCTGDSTFYQYNEDEKDWVEAQLGGAGIETGEGDNSIQQTGTGALALTERSIAIGENSKAGCRGYYIRAIDFDSNKLYLTGEFPTETYCLKDGNIMIYTYSAKTETDPESKKEYTEETSEAKTLEELGFDYITDDIGYATDNIDGEKNGAEVTFIVYGHRVAANAVVSYHYYSAARITSITNGVVQLTLNSDGWPFTSIIPVSREYSWYPSVIVPSQPEVGAVEIKQGAISLGGGLAVSESSVAIGAGSLAIGDYSYAGGRGTQAGYASAAMGADTTAMGVAAAAFGNNSHASGSYSMVAGYGNTASDTAAVALGSQNEATAQAAFAEGFDTHATNTAAHAEGHRATASGQYSHAENLSTLAEGNYSHAEGNGSHAKGNGSHAEGVTTHANAYCSHTEGQGTIASANHQHVQGKFNEANPTMVHIIGWGDSATSPKNIHTVDTSGNAWYAGDVKAGNISLTTVSGVANTAKSLAETRTGKILKGHNEIYNDLPYSAKGDWYDRFSPTDGGTWIGNSHIEGAGDPDKHYIKGSNQAHLEGANNIIIDSGSAHVGGASNYAKNSADTLIHGTHNEAINAPHSFVVGEGNKATKIHQTVVGIYNSTDNDALFIVGNGSDTADDKRGNAFVVKKNGTGYLGDKKIVTHPSEAAEGAFLRYRSGEAVWETVPNAEDYTF